MNYKVLENEKALDQFLSILPELDYGESFFITLFARSKYSNEIKGEASLYRSGKRLKDIKDSLMKLEVKEGLYTDNKGNIIPNSALVSYIKINPRSYNIANLKTVENINNNLLGIQKENDLKQFKLKHKIKNLLDNYSSEGVSESDLKDLEKIIGTRESRVSSPQTYALTALQDSVSRRLFVDVDLDIKHGEFGFTSLYNLLNIVFKDLKGVYSVVKTRGGFHVQLDLKELDRAGKWLHVFRSVIPDNVELEMNKDAFLPIPGTNQGGVEVELMLSNKDGILKLTSGTWNSFSETIILDPDGWDRKDFMWSYFKELITKEEYTSRLQYSTSVIK